MKRDGFTLIEGLLTLVILGVVVLYAYKLHAPIVTFFQRGQAHQQTTVNIRASLDFMTHALQSGKATSVRISNGLVSPNSQIRFVLASPLVNGTTAYAFFLTNRTLVMQEFRDPAFGPRPNPQTLADNVSGLIFANDTAEPSVVYVTLRIDPPAGASGGAVSTVQVLNQEIHLESNP